MPAEEQLTISLESDWIYGMIYRPDGPANGIVLFCNPLFEERKSSCRVMVETARSLRAQGFAVMTFDYRGCGDSSGEFGEFSKKDWLEDIATLVQRARQEYPGAPTGLLGLRLGASFAAEIAVSNPDINFLVMWEPVIDGPKHMEQELRKQVMKEMMTFGKGRSARKTLLETMERGSPIDFSGYSFTPALHASMKDMSLSRLAASINRPCFLVSITSSDAPSTEFEDLKNAIGAGCELLAVREPPFWNLVGVVADSAAARETVAWIGKTIRKV